MTNPELDQQKAMLEVSKLLGELASQRCAEVRQDLEIAKLQSEVSRVGKFTRLFWPIVSTALTLMIGFSTVQIQRTQSEAKDTELFNSAIASASQRPKDGIQNVAGLLSLSTFWGKGRDEAIADVAAGTFLSGSDARDAASLERDVLASRAAVTLITEATGGPGDRKQTTQEKKATALFFGEAGNSKRGSLSYVLEVLEGEESQLMQRQGSMTGPPPRRLQNDEIPQPPSSQQFSRDTIPSKYAQVGGADRRPETFIDLGPARLQLAMRIQNILSIYSASRAHLSTADLSYLNLYFIDLSQANLSEASLRCVDLTCADLSGADLSRVADWRELASIKYANIRDAAMSADFVRFARENGAVNLSEKDYSALRSKSCTSPIIVDRAGELRVRELELSEATPVKDRLEQKPYCEMLPSR
ncbi:pentapeptide repeat-containing protein [Terriglobus roseus]|uniref:Pentapeptide repeat-containing protein n=1 Tax=Terriglobus roseus TaxID=392734 RepID=A0A1H4NUK3_9BACT|nr:pentapeptide repeat-containing protein [Terriglobus roseus]SEB98322.1 Pentapeptide repeat-containing protein [Terriglobus roseus]